MGIDLETKNAKNLELITKLSDLLRDALRDKGIETELPQKRFNQKELTSLRFEVPIEGENCPVHIYRPVKLY